MSLEIIKADKSSQIGIIAQLAEVIWHDAYDNLLPEGQVDYMLEKFQSEKAVEKQIQDENYLYFLLCYEEKPVGFFAIVPKYTKQHDLFLSKIYLLPEMRGKGIIRKAFDFVEKQAFGFSAERIWLTVNKENLHAQNVYEHFGYARIESAINDIGGGFFMDDYIMEKNIK